MSSNINQNGDPLKSVFLQKQSEQLNHACPASDGEIYQKVRHYGHVSDDKSVEAWMMQWSSNK